MWAQKEEKEFWLGWLNHYRSLKCLWDDEAKREAGRAARYAAYQELADLAKAVNANADVAFVKGRINAFRTCYRREMRKVQAAIENGCKYEPQLFYYKTLDFLNDSSDMCDLKIYIENDNANEELEDGSLSIPDNLHKDNEPVQLPVDKGAAVKLRLRECFNSSSGDFNPRPATKRKLSNTEALESLDCDDFNSKNSLPSPGIVPLENENDEYEILGRRIAAHFRNMTPNQRLIAEKIITDVCIHGRMEKLTLDSALFIESPASKYEQVEQQEIDYDNPDTFIYTT